MVWFNNSTLATLSFSLMRSLARLTCETGIIIGANYLWRFRPGPCLLAHSLSAAELPSQMAAGAW